jgi:hypothetical protein
MPYARLIQRISSREALELATSGAKVLSCHLNKNLKETLKKGLAKDIRMRPHTPRMQQAAR